MTPKTLIGQADCDASFRTGLDHRQDVHFHAGHIHRPGRNSSNYQVTSAARRFLAKDVAGNKFLSQTSRLLDYLFPDLFFGVIGILLVHIPLTKSLGKSHDGWDT
jgi:hypothetical protein